MLMVFFLRADQQLPYSGSALGSPAGRVPAFDAQVQLLLSTISLQDGRQNIFPSLSRKMQPAGTIRMEPFEDSLGGRYGLVLQPTEQEMSGEHPSDFSM